jgi:transcription initiation factor IIE alpha subunit
LGKRKRRASEEIRETFSESYTEYREENPGCRPGISEFAEYSGLDYPTLKKLIDKMKDEGGVRIIQKGKKKEICLTENLQAGNAASSVSGYSENGRESFTSLLKNSYVKEHLSSLLSNKGSHMGPEGAAKKANIMPSEIAARIVNAIPFSNGKTDEKIVESLEADDEVSKWFKEELENEQKNRKYKSNKKRASPYLSKVRRYLFELFDKGVVSYNVETDSTDGWRTYLWHIKPSASAGLKKACISKMLEKKESLEGLKGKDDEFNYFCIKDKTHPVISFGSKSFVDDFKCEACGSGLVLEAGSQISDSIGKDLEKIKNAISEVGQIKV